MGSEFTFDLVVFRWDRVDDDFSVPRYRYLVSGN